MREVMMSLGVERVRACDILKVRHSLLNLRLGVAVLGPWHLLRELTHYNSFVKEGYAGCVTEGLRTTMQGVCD